MKAISACLLLLCVAALPVSGSAAESAPAEKTDAVKRHPLRGVVKGILPDRSALLVKHENVPGVMPAMTMIFKVDAATLQTVNEGDAITGLMSRQGNTWVLEDVKRVAARKG